MKGIAFLKGSVAASCMVLLGLLLASGVKGLLPGLAG